MEAEKANGGSSLAPFLAKCYDMVDDPSTEGTVSWSKTSNSFVIWDPHAFSQNLLPKYFKHSNLSSFVRQLNTYAFHKVDPDRWEFANERFLRGQKHLLKSITRRKPSHNIVLQQQPQLRAQNLSVKAFVEVGNFGFKEEIEMLDRDKNALMQELIKLRQHQQNSELELHSLRQGIQNMEQNQLEMMSLLAIVVQSPTFIVQLVQQNVNKRWTDINKRRRLPAPEPEQNNVIGGTEAPAADGQIIKYQPFVAESMMKSSFVPAVTTHESSSLQKVSSTSNNLHINGDCMSSDADLSLPSQGDACLAGLDVLEHLFASSVGENGGQIEPQTLTEYMQNLDFTEHEITGYTSDLFAQQEMGIEHLLSETGSEHMVV